MKLLNFTKHFLQSSCLILLLNACVGDDFPEDAVANGANSAANANANANDDNNANADNTGLDDANDNSNNDNGDNADGNSNGNNNNNNNGNNLLNDNNDNNASDKEFVNNAAGNDFLDENPAVPAAKLPENAAVEENSTEDLGIAAGGAIVGGNEASSAAIAPPNTNVGATDTSLAPSRGSSKPNKNGKVHYVLQNGSSAYDKPDGKVVKTYEQGDHPVVTAEGEWLQTTEGMFVPSATLTTRPIPRAKSVKSWR